jgi:hypothetical protein
VLLKKSKLSSGGGVGCSCRWGETVSELQSPTNLLFITEVIYEYGQPLCNDIDRENRRTLRKTCITAMFCTINPTWNNPGANHDLGSVAGD